MSEPKELREEAAQIAWRADELRGRLAYMETEIVRRIAEARRMETDRD